MKHQHKVGINWIAVATLALASAAAVAGGNVSSSGGTVNEVYGRAGVTPAGINSQAVHSTGKGTVSEVSGRGSQISNASSVRVDANATDVSHYGRGSAPLAASKGKQPQGETLAQSR